MKILLVDDHSLIGKSLEITLKNSPEVSQFKHISNPKIAQSVVLSYSPSIVLMDIHMGDYNGLELGEQLLKKFPIKLVFLSGFDLIEYKERAMSINAHGFLDKHITVEDLINQLKKIYFENKRIFPEKEENNFAYQSLTSREKEVLQLLSQGIKQTAIATKLSVSERTVRNHIYSINEKLETNSAITSVIKAIELGIVNVHLQ
ncbi:response regulator [Lysinibacillus sp. NPDC094403]|uniref:response regulator n=1 Tax=Lysinibacillus sp. NPDC094403 TaxID=3390581 RepID=UPI003D074E92